MDDRVDHKYKNKHFPPSYFAGKPGNAHPPTPSSDIPTTIHDSTPESSKATKANPVVVQTVAQLISGFAGLSIVPAPPMIEGTPAPPCPIAELPEEIIVEIMRATAVCDVAAFAQLAQVCKRFAYLVATEERIWRRVCLGSEVGFGAMHYSWQRAVLGGPLEFDGDERQLGTSDDDRQDPAEKNHEERDRTTEMLLNDVYSSSWLRMFKSRPRIRFNGCYISTVNYMRPGQASTSQSTWQTPVHIVTYYRYLRFFRDGTLISLLTITEPAEVVHHLTKDIQEIHRKGAGAHLPSAVMRHAFKGRWRLSTAEDNAEEDHDPKNSEGEVYIETEGVDPKYVYRMELALNSARRGARNNKLAWKGFWSYNKLTDDWGKFGLKNDKPFFWSRVKSYGTGA